MDKDEERRVMIEALTKIALRDAGPLDSEHALRLLVMRAGSIASDALRRVDMDEELSPLVEVYRAAGDLIGKIRAVQEVDQQERLAQVRKVEEVRRWAQNEIIKLEP